MTVGRGLCHSPASPSPRAREGELEARFRRCPRTAGCPCAWWLAGCGACTRQFRLAGPSGGPSGSASTATGGTVNIGWAGAPDSLNPGNGLLEESYILYELVYDTPIGLDGEGNFVPELATHWTSSEDGLTWTMKLVDNAKFHDGTPLTSGT